MWVISKISKASRRWCVMRLAWGWAAGIFFALFPLPSTQLDAEEIVGLDYLLSTYSFFPSLPCTFSLLVPVKKKRGKLGP